MPTYEQNWERAIAARSRLYVSIARAGGVVVIDPPTGDEAQERIRLLNEITGTDPDATDDEASIHECGMDDDTDDDTDEADMCILCHCELTDNTTNDFSVCYECRDRYRVSECNECGMMISGVDTNAPVIEYSATYDTDHPLCPDCAYELGL